MKKRASFIFIILGIILIAAAIFVALVVLPVGDNISLIWSNNQVPGAVPEAWMLPKADTADVGRTVTLDLPQILEDAQYDDQDPLNGDHPEHLYIAYLYNTKENTGRLAVINQRADNRTMCHVTIYEPEWAGGEALCENLQKPFRAKIIHRANIFWQEGTRYFEAMLQGALQDPSLIIDTATYQKPTDAPTVQCFYGIFFYYEEYDDSVFMDVKYLIDDGIGVHLQLHELLPKDKRNQNVFLRIVEKYGLSTYMGTD